MTIITVYTLFFDDIRAALIPIDADDAFYSITCVCFALFLFEIILASIVQQGYLFSFFFWLDICATFSMIFDIGWITNSFQNASQAGDFGSLAKSSRAARVTRIIRLVRLIRLVRIVKLYKQAKLAQQRREEAKLAALKHKKGISENKEDEKKNKIQRQITNLKQAGLFANQDEDMPVESKISKTLTEKNQKILIILILVILFLNPVFLAGTFFSDDPAPEIGLDHLMDIYDKTYKLGTNKDIYTANYNKYISIMKDYDYPIIKLSVPVYGITYYNTPLSELRDEEFTEYESSNSAYVIYSTKQWNVWESWINIGRTIMVCILLTASSYLINRDANILVLDPIERMIERIRIVAKNPMALCSEEEIESAGALALVQSQNKKKKKENDENDNETAFLEASLFTIGRLLGLCFGEAGAKIIGKNIASSEIGSDFNPLIPGMKELAIFGFCDIRGFADATLALEEDVMRFVNQIAEIVHSEADLHQGSSNKNLGEAFLMVWKFPRDDIDSFDDELTIRPDNKECNTLADLAVLSFLKTITKINKYSHIIEYSRNEKILARIRNYKVNMGFGIHFGWGIEGAIGSPYKIDASYLSPNVNIAARLEAATRQYGVSILISGELQELLTEPFKEITRLIDIVTVKGSAVPMKFYTVNLCLTALEEEKAPLEGLLPKKKKEIRNELK